MTETNTLIVCIECATNLYLKSRPDLQEQKLNFKQEAIKAGHSTKDIYQKLSRSVIGQDRAKKVLSVALTNHLKRIHVDPLLEKNNVLLIGSTGTGKTQLVRELAEITDLPLGIADASSITSHGWAGDDPETVLFDLYQKSGEDVDKAKYGIVFIDEIDKLANDSDTRYRSQNAQRGLLRILEGTVVGVPVNKDKRVFIDTSHILFICAGAFSDLQHIIDKRYSKKGIGFHSVVGKEDFREKEATTEDLESYGFTPEFLGRIHTRAKLDDLDVTSLRQILTKPENSLTSQYIRMFELDGIKLEFSSTGLEEIAKQALELKTGARGLKTILERVLFNYQFEYEENELYITKDLVREKLGLKEELIDNEVQSRNHRF
jgi:ATP-dependent Clp protease ATP-binding subunit ClpX